MSGPARISATDRVNYLNIGLMVVSCAVALFVPFELFLFAYAVLGPGHYLTEISWLQKRRFFTKGKYDLWLLGALVVLVCFVGPWSSAQATCTFIAVGVALVLVITDKAMPRFWGLLAVALVTAVLVQSAGFAVLLVGLFVPTLIHVYLFTGFFMFYGALKERSQTGYLACGLFVICPLVCLFVNPGRTPSAQAMVHYWNNFSILNQTVLGVAVYRTADEAHNAFRQVFRSSAGLMFMRFVAFAYTYHYLNWFSKTSIIRWHEVGAKQMVAVVTLWLAAVGIYIYDFRIGFKVLFYLSLAHVFLEFPLNHVSIIGVYKEIASKWGPPVQPVLPQPRKGRKKAAAAR